jgi:hypothetical protein
MRPQACDQAIVLCSFCTGIITRPKSGGDVQDVKITGIPLENARLAIRLVGATPRKILSEAQKAALASGPRFMRHGDKSPHSSETTLEYYLPPFVTTLGTCPKPSSPRRRVDCQTSASAYAKIPCGGPHCIAEPGVMVRGPGESPKEKHLLPEPGNRS